MRAQAARRTRARTISPLTSGSRTFCYAICMVYWVHARARLRTPEPVDARVKNKSSEGMPMEEMRLDGKNVEVMNSDSAVCGEELEAGAFVKPLR